MGLLLLCMETPAGRHTKLTSTDEDEEAIVMGRRRSVMSESFKYELAKDLGFYDVVQREGWEGIRTKDAGNMVKRAIQIAEEHLAKQQMTQTPASYTQSGAQQGGYGQSYNQGGYRPSPPMTSGSQAAYPSGAYNVNASFPYQNQPPAQGMNTMPAGNEQTSQDASRPSYS